MPTPQAPIVVADCIAVVQGGLARVGAALATQYIAGEVQTLQGELDLFFGGGGTRGTDGEKGMGRRQ